MTMDLHGDQARELHSDTQKEALLGHLSEALRVMPLQKLWEVVDVLCGPGTADAVLAERRRQADEAHRMVQRLWHERYRDDPEGAAEAEARVRRSMERITARTEEIAHARAARLASKPDQE
ncbi:hypothetical protein [Nonomuraea salmonea]|uniref:Uncharacterized protein n=1 Tax=Nonomuraea salmonea TaxID=46181 RepID=A0ABV5NWR4_9ACTN